MSKEAQIKTTLEEYLNLESTLKDYYQAREEAIKKYNRLADEHHTPANHYTTHAAAPIISAYEEIKMLDSAIDEARKKLHETGGKIKEYIRVLRGRPLEMHFAFDGLTHREGTHTFSLDNEELKVSYEKKETG